MTTAMQQPIKLFQFPRMFGIPNLSPFCCKMETWLRIAGIPYEVVDTPDPRKGPKGKLPFIDDGGIRAMESSRESDGEQLIKGGMSASNLETQWFYKCK